MVCCTPCVHGAAGEARTRGIRRGRAVLYPLSYDRKGNRSLCRRSQWQDSNLRPPVSETGALAKLSHTELVAVAGREPADLLNPIQPRYHAAAHHDPGDPYG